MSDQVLDFEKATEVAELLHDYTSQNYHAAYEASLNAQAAALVEAAKREEREAIWVEFLASSQRLPVRFYTWFGERRGSFR